MVDKDYVLHDGTSRIREICSDMENIFVQLFIMWFIVGCVVHFSCQTRKIFTTTAQMAGQIYASMYLLFCNEFNNYIQLIKQPLSPTSVSNLCYPIFPRDRISIF